MQVVNWLAVKPGEVELQGLKACLGAITYARKMRQRLVLCILMQYPWDGRNDLAQLYQPSGCYQKGDWLAWIRRDPKDLNPPKWELGQVAEVENVENPVQGQFQVITVRIQGKKRLFGAGISTEQEEDFDFSQFSQEEWEALAEQIADVYARPLQTVLERLVQNGKLPGRFAGETFVRSDLPLIDPDELAEYFDRLTLSMSWISAGKLLAVIREREELKDLPDDILLPLLRLALEKSRYHPLGADRWTTEEIYDQLNREIVRGLPVPHVRSKLDVWTEDDLRDLGSMETTSVPNEVHDILDEEPIDDIENVEEIPWQPPSHPICLTTLSYLHITQAYFPIRRLIDAFSPDVRLVMVQIIDGEYQPFLVDRHLHVLKAVDKEKMRTALLEAGEAGIPAGSHLWLEYQAIDRFRVKPKPLDEPKKVPCKLASMVNGRLQIKHEDIYMKYEGYPAVFKAELRFEEIEALFAEARMSGLSVRDAVIQSVQELCAADPRKAAYYRDIFNTVFLKRMCSPNSVAAILYGTPCFIKTGDGFFQYKESPITTTTQHNLRHRPRHRSNFASNSRSKTPRHAFQKQYGWNIKTKKGKLEVVEVPIQTTEQNAGTRQGIDGEISNPDFVQEESAKVQVADVLRDNESNVSRVVATTPVQGDTQLVPRKLTNPVMLQSRATEESKVEREGIHLKPTPTPEVEEDAINSTQLEPDSGGGVDAFTSHTRSGYAYELVQEEKEKITTRVLSPRNRRQPTKRRSHFGRIFWPIETIVTFFLKVFWRNDDKRK